MNSSVDAEKNPNIFVGPKLELDKIFKVQIHESMGFSSHQSGKMDIKKKVQAVGLYIDSNLPLVVQNSLRNKYLVYCEFLNRPICNFLIEEKWEENNSFQALDWLKLFRNAINSLWRHIDM